MDVRWTLPTVIILLVVASTFGSADIPELEAEFLKDGPSLEPS